MSQASITVSPQDPRAVRTTTTFSDGSKPAVINTKPQDGKPVEPVPVSAEPKAPEAKVESKEDKERFEQMARREKAIRTEARKLELLKKEWESKQAPQQPAFDKAAFLKDPTKYGLSNDELSNIVLSQLNQSPESQMIKELQSQIEELKKGQETVKQDITSQQTAAYKQAIQQISREVDSLITSNEEYAAIQAEGAQSAVVELIETTYKEDGVLLSTEDAAKQVEEFLFERALKLAELNKVKSRLAPKAPEVTEPTTPEATHTPRTLTNNLVTSSKPLTARERRERAIAAFRGQHGG